MLLLSAYIAHCLEVYERLKGARTLVLLHTAVTAHDSYLALTNTGAIIEIFCKEISYKISYKKWWVPNKYVTMYHVYCNYSKDIEPDLKAMLSEDLVLTQLIHPWSHKASQKRSVVEAYVDLVLSKYKKSTS